MKAWFRTVRASFSYFVWQPVAHRVVVLWERLLHKIRP